MRDGIYDRTGRAPRALVRAAISREPYVVNLCQWHLDQLIRILPAGGVHIVKRYSAERPYGARWTADTVHLC